MLVDQMNLRLFVIRFSFPLDFRYSYETSDYVVNSKRYYSLGRSNFLYRRLYFSPLFYFFLNYLRVDISFNFLLLRNIDKLSSL